MRDPRFEKLSGHFNQDLFEKSYAFLDDYKKSEQDLLRQQIKKAKNPERREELQQLLLKMVRRKGGEIKERGGGRAWERFGRNVCLTRGAPRPSHPLLIIYATFRQLVKHQPKKLSGNSNWNVSVRRLKPSLWNKARHPISWSDVSLWFIFLVVYARTHTHARACFFSAFCWAFSLSIAEQRKLELMDKYEKLGEKNMDKILAKRRKKNAAKDHRRLPFKRRSE